MNFKIFKEIKNFINNPNKLIRESEMNFSKKKNIPNNFRGKEDLFFKKVRDGLKKFLESPFIK